MKITDLDQGITEFLHFVATKKRNLSDWQFLHVSVLDTEQPLQIDEVTQFLEFQVQTDTAWLLRITKSKDLLLVAHKSDSLTLNKFEKLVYENFSSDALRCLLKGFDADGIEQFSRIIEPHIQKEDLPSLIAFKRMSRIANCFLILDDDLMVLKQLEKIFSGFGNVVTIQNADQFPQAYQEYAPNVLFLDVHLRTAKGNEILKDLKSNVDPNAHVVMISSDTNQDLIMDIKQGGANGFIVKPFDRNKLYKEIMKTPTIMAKTG